MVRVRDTQASLYLPINGEVLPFYSRSGDATRVVMSTTTGHEMARFLMTNVGKLALSVEHFGYPPTPFYDMLLINVDVPEYQPSGGRVNLHVTFGVRERRR